MSKIGTEVNHILKEIKLKRKGAFERLVSATYNHLKVVAFNYLQDKNDVEDVVNETYLKVHRYIESADFSKDGYNWMCKIVQNLARDYNKKFENQSEAISRVDEGELFYVIDERFFDFCQLSVAIRALDSMQQMLLYYRFWEGYSLSELSQKFQMKRSTVNKKLKKIYKLLKENFSEEGQSP